MFDNRGHMRQDNFQMAARAAHTSYFTFDIGVVTRRSLRVIAMQRRTRGWEGARDAEEESCCDRIVIYCARGSVAKYRCKRY